MKNYLFAFIGLFVILFSPARAQKKGDVVYLRNGSVLKGHIVQNSPNSGIKIESAGNLWFFSPAEVDSIVQHARIEKHARIACEKPYYFAFEGGVLSGNSDNDKDAPFSLDAAFYYRVKEKLSAGLGVGVDLLNETYLPVYAGGQYALRNSGFSPVFGLKVGYLFALEDASYFPDKYYSLSSSSWPGPSYQSQELEAKGGFFVNPSVGFVSMIHQNLGISFAVGYRFHTLKYTGEDNYELENEANRLTLKIGLIFN